MRAGRQWALRGGEDRTPVSWLRTRVTTGHELAAGYVDERERQLVERRLVRCLVQLGYEVALQPAVLAAQVTSDSASPQWF